MLSLAHADIILVACITPQPSSTSTYLGHFIPLLQKPWQDDTGFSIFSFASLLVTAKVKTQYLPHILSKYYSGSKAWNRYLKWNREWRLLGKRDSQTHDTPFAILLPLLELDLSHWMFSHFLGTDFWYKCRVCSKDLMKHWNFPFHQKEGVGMISFPILARPSVW